MEHRTKSLIAESIRDTGTAYVQLFDGLKIYLIECLAGTAFVGTFLPCAKNAKRYTILADEIKGLVDDTH